MEMMTSASATITTTSAIIRGERVFRVKTSCFDNSARSSRHGPQGPYNWSPKPTKMNTAICSRVTGFDGQ